MNDGKSILFHLLSSSENNLTESLKNFSLKDVAFQGSNVDGGVLKKCFHKNLYNEEWDSDADIPLAMLHPNNSTELSDISGQIFI